jgi:hypothetical protein
LNSISVLKLSCAFTDAIASNDVIGALGGGVSGLFCGCGSLGTLTSLFKVGLLKRQAHSERLWVIGKLAEKISVIFLGDHDNGRMGPASPSFTLKI